MFSFTRRAFDHVNEGGGAASPMPHARRPKIGLALSSGVARGWSHIGVVQEFAAQGIHFDVIAGTSIGAVVGGCHAAGRLDAIESFARSLTKRSVLGLMDFSFSSVGLIGGGKLKGRLLEALGDRNIEDLPNKFAAIATESGSGHEVWFTKGNMVEAIRASYAMPGIFEPVNIGGRWLFDGAFVNPIPITVCRALGADLVVAVQLNAEHSFRSTVISDPTAEVMAPVVNSLGGGSGILNGLRGRADSVWRQFAKRDDGAPGMASAMVDVFNITQDRIARSRLAGDPPDFSISCKLGKIGLFDFHRADEMIQIGRETARKAMPELREQFGLNEVKVGA